MATKRFKHDCNKCVFLGTTTDNLKRRYDLYLCRNKETPSLSSLIARFGNKGPEYLSGLVCQVHTNVLLRAQELARQQEFLSIKQKIAIDYPNNKGIVVFESEDTPLTLSQFSEKLHDHALFGIDYEESDYRNSSFFLLALSALEQAREYFKLADNERLAKKETK